MLYTYKSASSCISNTTIKFQYALEKYAVRLLNSNYKSSIRVAECKISFLERSIVYWQQFLNANTFRFAALVPITVLAIQLDHPTLISYFSRV